MRSPMAGLHGAQSLTKRIRFPSKAKSEGHEPFRRCSARTDVSAFSSNSARTEPFGQTTRTTSAPVWSPRPKWTSGPAMSCFCTSSPARISISPPTPKELMRWSPVAFAARGRINCQ